MSQAKSRRRAVLINATLTAVAFALLGLAIWSNREQVRQVLVRPPGTPPIDLPLLGTAFAVYMTALMLTFYRWFILVRALGLPFRVRDALRLGFIGNVFNLVIPGAVGGDVIKAAYLCREQARKTQAVSSMVIDRALGLLGLFLLASATGFGVWATAGPDARKLITVVWAAATTGTLGLGLLFLPVPYQRLVAGWGRLETLVSELVAMASAYRRRIGVIVGMLVLAMGIHTLYVLAFYMVSRAIFPVGIPTLAQHLLMVPLALFTTAVPLPFGALGLSEQVSDQLFRLVGHPGGAVAMMGYRVLMYGGGLVSVLVYLANVGQVRDLTHDLQPPERDLVATEA